MKSIVIVSALVAESRDHGDALHLAVYDGFEEMSATDDEQPEP